MSNDCKEKRESKWRKQARRRLRRTGGNRRHVATPRLTRKRHKAMRKAFWRKRIERLKRAKAA